MQRKPDRGEFIQWRAKTLVVDDEEVDDPFRAVPRVPPLSASGSRYVSNGYSIIVIVLCV